MKAASVYASRLGWAVVPLHDVSSGSCSCGKPQCPSAGKHPRLNKWEQEATSDAEAVSRWAKQWPRANPGIATGEPSGFFVLDVDPDKGGAETLADLLAEHGELPETAEQRTGSGGTHYLFALPEGETIRNSAGKLGKGLDTRGDGGQIVVAPSVSAKGKYTWVRPPWVTPPAPAPEWLLDLLRSTAPARPAPSTGAPVTFPPASTEVLDQARAALEVLGQAIDGQGGGLKAVQAASILTHDFALTDDEAWPLLVEWNEANEPPYSTEETSGENSLSVRLERGRKYGSAPYGCKRTVDAGETIKALIAAYNTGTRGDAALYALVEQCRPLIGVISDPTRRALLSDELGAAAGLSVRALGLPDAPRAPIEVPKGSILVGPELHEAADDATKAIAKHVFSRNGVLCEVVKDPARTFISDLETNRVLDLMSRSAKWMRADDKGTVVTAPPMPIAQIVHSRRDHKGVRVLEAVTTSPIFLADGSILSARGYNAQARVFLEPSVEVEVPDEPTRDEAREAIRRFKRLVSQFDFATPADFSAWLAGVLSPLVKAAIHNAPVPLVCVSAAVAGSGKTKLTTIASLIVTGQPAEVRPYNPRDPSEWGKRVTAFVRAASPVSVFDNVNGAFGDETIDRLITSTTWSDRVLGASDAPPIPVVTTWWATGNNLAPEGDTVRRVLVVRLDVKTERPAERTFEIEDIEKHTLESRAELLTAALTILRAYHVAGRPDQNLPAWGSFDAWSGIVRAALVWCGLSDPHKTQQRASEELNEPDNEAHDFWLSVVEGCDGTTSAMVAAANAADAQSVLGARGQITSFTLRNFIGRFIDRPRAGRRIRRDRGMNGAVVYLVEKLSPA